MYVRMYTYMYVTYVRMCIHTQVFKTAYTYVCTYVILVEHFVWVWVWVGVLICVLVNSLCFRMCVYVHTYLSYQTCCVNCYVPSPCSPCTSGVCSVDSGRNQMNL